MFRGSWWLEGVVLAVALVMIAGAATADAPSARRQTELRRLLDHDCGSCHGLTRRGGLGPALSSAALDDRDDEVLVDTILYGRRGTPMAPWGFEVSRSEARWLVDLMRGR